MSRLGRFRRRSSEQKIDEKGVFPCPSCQADREYWLIVRREVRGIFRSEVATFVDCRICGNRFSGRTRTDLLFRDQRDGQVARARAYLDVLRADLPVSGVEHVFPVVDERPIGPSLASILEVGGFRPTGEVTASNFGQVALGAPGERFPVGSDGEPMQFICQLNLDEAPVVPPNLAGVALITCFTEGRSKWTDRDNTPWCIRTYESLENLQVLDKPDLSPLPDHERWLFRSAEARWRSETGAELRLRAGTR